MGRPEEIAETPYKQPKKTKEELEHDFLWKDVEGKFCKFKLHEPASMNFYELHYFDKGDGVICKMKLSNIDRINLIRLLNNKQ